MSFITCGELSPHLKIPPSTACPHSHREGRCAQQPEYLEQPMSACGMALTVSRLTKKVWSMADEMVHVLLEVRIPVVVKYHAQIEHSHPRSTLNEKGTATERYYHMC